MEIKKINEEKVSMHASSGNINLDKEKKKITNKKDKAITTNGESYNKYLNDIEIILDRIKKFGQLGTWEYSIKEKHLTMCKEAKRICGFHHKLKKNDPQAVIECIPDFERIFNLFISSLKTRKRFEHELRFRLPKSKQIIILNCITEVFFDKDKKPEKIFGIIQDITESTLALKWISKSETKCRSLFNEIRDAIVVEDNNKRIIDCNPGFNDMFGYTCSEILGREILCIYEDEENFLESEIVLKEHLVKNLFFVVNYKRKDGTIFPGETGMFRLKGFEDIRIVKIIRDITERKKAEEELHETNALLHSYAAHLQNVREEERIHIAREIHDEVGHMLTELRLDLEEIVDHSGSVRNNQEQKLSELLSLVDSTIDCVRNIATELRPGVLDHLGLLAALEWQAQQFQIRSKIKCMFSSNTDFLNLPDNASTEVFRIFQEILTNITRHSKATEVEVSIVKTDDYFILKVKDNGIGFRLDEINKSSSLGLLGMSERAHSIGGYVNISADYYSGTIVTLSLRIDNSSRAERNA